MIEMYTFLSAVIANSVFVCVCVCVVRCWQCASYAVGNAAYHGPELYALLRPAIPFLLRLLRDPLAKIRANAAGVIFNF